MKTVLLKKSFFLFTAFLFPISILLAHDSSSYIDNSMKMEHHNMHMMKMKNDSSNVIKMDSTKNSIIREGEIDLKAIDANKDGYVYQDMMDYNVISDKPGTCSLCGMILKKVTLKKAKEILLKSGFEVKG